MQHALSRSRKQHCQVNAQEYEELSDNVSQMILSHYHPNNALALQYHIRILLRQRLPLFSFLCGPSKAYPYDELPDTSQTHHVPDHMTVDGRNVHV